MKSCVTISLVEEARGGPFVYWDDLEGSARKAKKLGFDAIEIFPPSPDAVDPAALRPLLDELGLEVAAVGTGAGWVKGKRHLCLPEQSHRDEAGSYIRAIIDLAAQFEASAIIGSMQGRSGDGVDHQTAMSRLSDALNELGEYAGQYNLPLIYEPLNRYETNLVNTIAGGVALLETLSTSNVVLLADLFHMNIEEADVADAIRAGKGHIGHVHFVDSNRKACGMGHTDFGPIAAALKEIGYDRYLSAEAFALPDSDVAAKHTIDAFRKYIAA